MSTPNVDIIEMDEVIKDIKEKVRRLIDLSQGMPCVDCNCERIMAGLKMLELNISDAREWLE